MKSEKVVQLDDYRPHLAILLLNEDVVVVPRMLLLKLIQGELAIDEVDGWEILIRSILSDWLEMLEGT